MVTVSKAQTHEPQDAPPIAAAVQGGDPPIHLTDNKEENEDRQPRRKGRAQQCLSLLNWMPPWCRWDKEKPPKFSIWMNILFAFAGAFTVANLYYKYVDAILQRYR